MRIIRTSALVALLLMPCLAAHADGDRYIEFSASPAFATKLDTAHATLKYVPGTVSVSFGKPQFLTGEFGAQLSNYFAAGLQVSYLYASTHDYAFRTQQEIHGVTIDYAQSGDVTGHVIQGTLLLMGHAEYPVGRFVPVIGAGLGLAITNISDLALNGSTSAQDIHLYEDGGYSFTYEFSGGFDWWVLKSAALTARYVYMNCDDPSFRTYTAHLADQHLALGIKFLF